MQKQMLVPSTAYRCHHSARYYITNTCQDIANLNKGIFKVIYVCVCIYIIIHTYIYVCARKHTYIYINTIVTITLSTIRKISDLNACTHVHASMHKSTYMQKNIQINRWVKLKTRRKKVLKGCCSVIFFFFFNNLVQHLASKIWVSSDVMTSKFFNPRIFM